MRLNNVRQVNPRAPETVVIREAGQVIARGGVIAFPTRNLYGLGADAFNPESIERIFGIKRRPAQKPLLILIKHRSELERTVRYIPPAAKALMDHFWPGGLTIIFEAKARLPLNLTANSGKIGVRLPAHPVAAALVKAVSNPITGTSANISGEDGCSDISQLAPSFKQTLDLILDAGALPPGIGSSIIDVTVEPFQILREGMISVQRLKHVLKRH